MRPSPHRTSLFVDLLGQAASNPSAPHRLYNLLTILSNSTNSPFRPVKSITKYALVIVKFVSFLLRTAEHPDHASYFMSSQIKAATDYAKYLENPADLCDFKDCIHSKLQSLLAENVCYQRDEFIPDLEFPICRFLCYAALSDRGTFIRASQVTEVLAAMQYLVRATVMNEMVRIQANAKSGRTEKLSCGALLEKYTTFVREGVQTPYNQLRETMHFASSFAINEIAIGRVKWLKDDGKTFMIDGIPLHLNDLQEWVATGIKEATHYLYQKCLHDMPIPDNVVINEKYANGTLGYSFIHDLKPYHFEFLQYVSHQPRLHSLFVTVDDGETIQFSRDAIQQWLKDSEHLLDVLAALIHLTSGQPSRATELSELTYANGSGTRRGMSYFCDRLVTLMGNSKAHSEASRNKGIPRFIARPVSRIIEHYLIFVRPVAIYFSNYVGLSGAEPMSVYLFASPAEEHNWSGAHLRTVFAKCISRWFKSGQTLSVGQFRHVAIALTRFHLAKTSQADSILDLQAAHGSRIANDRYGRDQYAHPDIPPDVARGYEHASDEWAALLGIDSGQSPTDMSSIAIDPSVRPASMEQGLARSFSAVHKALQGLYGDDAQFTSVEQEIAIMRVLARQEDLLVVLPTGGGKSLLFQLPPILEPDLTTVVILPLIVLMVQFSRTIPGLATERWVFGQKPNPLSRLVLISAEDAGRDIGFREYVHQLYAQGQLARIVFDECHAFPQQQSFRPIMDSVCALRTEKLPVPILLLSATSSPSELNLTKSYYGCLDIRTIRRPTNRPNLRLRVRMVQSHSKIDAEIIAFVAANPASGSSRGIIYSATRRLVSNLAPMIQTATNIKVGMYYGEMTKEDKKVSLEKWLLGDTPWIIATSAFGMGVHHDQVRWVLHYGQTYSLADYYQQIGRISRDGQEGLALTISSEDFVPTYLDGYDVNDSAKRDRDVVQAYLFQNRICRRRVLSKHFDLVESACGGENIECDVCEGISPPSLLIRVRGLHISTWAKRHHKSYNPAYHSPISNPTHSSPNRPSWFHRYYQCES
jgi:superfamily II DNA or RNA helicase